MYCEDGPQCGTNYNRLENNTRPREYPSEQLPVIYRFPPDKNRCTPKHRRKNHIPSHIPSHIPFHAFVAVFLHNILKSNLV